jgi:hypothetical protein
VGLYGQEKTLKSSDSVRKCVCKRRPGKVIEPQTYLQFQELLSVIEQKMVVFFLLIKTVLLDSKCFLGHKSLLKE